MTSMASLGAEWCLISHRRVLGCHLAVDAGRALRAGSVIAQQLGSLLSSTAVDHARCPTILLIGNFLTILGVTLLFAPTAIILSYAAL